ncbi:hypothetical protein [Secundilactobacillus kimchicus]|uniref:Uncharacterized protein n=1 Tax=Secundilactobacillus kimchicus JCM 15530 TaxID=1302272 RepID=A0A0R1HVR6_9LACO|nr:hypothetical protein [Secundilactobacillus kimchicus]KRK47538.1 hypothetical protein FC96_GL002465 [Secundilactobacillus kimchicus JCM 15530]MBT9671657.1 hypothetical protein [Secundilactobacillus kimchicus]
MGPASDATIRRFLLEFKKSLRRGQWHIVQRTVDYARITEMTPKAIKIILLGLTPNATT